MSVKNNLAEVKQKIAAACQKVGRDPNEITVIGVTKYVTIEKAEELIEAGITNLGENRAEGLDEKFTTIGNRADWHFIGTLQSRKVRDVIGKVKAIHSLDRESVAKQITNRAENTVDCFVQVNISEEETKHGLTKETVIPFIEKLAAYDKVRIVGLMTMAPHIEDEAELREVFRTLRGLRDQISALQLSHAPCEYLSMGMSNDYDIAIEEGATHIRLGTTLVES